MVSYLFPLILLAIICFVGFLIIFIGLPGLFVITIGAFVYGLLTGFVNINWTIIIILLAIAITAEIIEFFFGIFFAKRFKVSKNGITGGIIGSIIGAIVGVPIPVVGSLVGMFTGAFVGAFLFEYLKNKNIKLAYKAGTGVLLGKGGAILIKVALAVIMLIIIFVKVF